MQRDAGIAWVVLFVYAGYYFGNMPITKRNFSFVILGIIIVSMMLGFIEFLRHRHKKAKGVEHTA